MPSCKLCFKDIAFSNEPEYISATGKMIPLDVNPAGVIIGKHNCHVWRQMNRKYYPCKKCKNELIYFDEKLKSKSGRWVPISKTTGFPHRCPNDDY